MSAKPIPSARTGGRRPAASGFTLVEVIVAIGVLIILAALILPVTLRQMEAGRSAACVAKLKNLGVAIRLWRNENNDALVPSTNVLAWRPSRHLYEAGAISSPVEMMCPSVNTLAKGAWADVVNNWGSAYQIAFYNQPISYGVNTIAFNQSTPKGWGSNITSSYRMFIGKESHVPIFFDSKAWQANSTVWADNELRLGRFAFPHSNRSNVLFLDGHVEGLDRQGVLALNPLGDAGKKY
ncbi:MAG TPA: prepilin-type N-terminal cleavage/methylation domain-containing protein [Chthoniobacteraceae bacterium]|nr:prepilin-type N-terminal cleavage/methylation domain-containing protein [Chthoniobacteraceae bacterium]